MAKYRAHNIHLIKLENRVVFDAAMPLVADVVGDALDSVADNVTSPDVNQSEDRVELVVIERGLGNATKIQNSLRDNQHSIFIDKNDKGLERVKGALQLLGSVDALHLITHANEHGFSLGSDTITESSAEHLNQWSDHFKEGADILFYGCSLAKEQQGVSLLEKVAKATRADIQASTDDTGLKEKGANWYLEHQIGQVESKIILSPELFYTNFAAQPDATFGSDINKDVLIGEQITFTVQFENTDLVDTGFGPYINLLMPYLGKDGTYDTNTKIYTDEVDGISFVSAKFIEQTLAHQIVTIKDGSFEHPFAIDSAGEPVMVSVDGSLGFNSGDQVVIFRLPFGSYTTDQPKISIVITANVDNKADVNEALPIVVNSGFEFGNTPVNDFGTDPTIQASVISAENSAVASVTPQLYKVSSSFKGINGEAETPSGPNFPRSMEVTVVVAPGQTLTPSQIEYTLPESLKFLNADSVGGTPSANPLQNIAGSTADDKFTMSYTSLSGTKVMSVDFYVDEFEQDGTTRVIPVTGGSNNIQLNKNIQVTRTWDPIDIRDSTDSIKNNTFTADTVLAKSLAIQKDTSATVFPGEKINYTVKFEVSDFFKENNFQIVDIISDGQDFDTSFTPILDVKIGGVSLPSMSVSPSNRPVLTNLTGEQVISFNINQVLIDNGVSSGILTGVRFMGASTGEASATLTYRTDILDSYIGSVITGSIKAGDALTNNVTISADVLNSSDSDIGDDSDSSSSFLRIPRGKLDISIYKVNGIDPTGFIQPGDEVTYRFKYDAKLRDIKDFNVKAFIPLPIFQIGDPDANNVPGPSWSQYFGASLTPPAGQYKIGPTATVPFDGTSVLTVTPNTSSNFLDFSVADYDDVVNQAATFDVLVTLKVNTSPFADGLVLAVFSPSSESSTSGDIFVDNDITAFTLQQPSIKSVIKGAIATNKAASGEVFSEGYTPEGNTDSITPASQFYDAGNTNAVPFDTSGGFKVNSDNLASLNLDSDVNGVDRGDLVRFVLILENTGSGVNGAFDIQFKDTVPSGFQEPSGGINLRIVDGAGSVKTYSYVDGGAADDFAALFGQGVELTDSATGAASAYNNASGANIIVATYDLEAATTVEATSTVTSSATLINYSNIDGGTDFTATDLTNPASITIPEAIVTKSVTPTDATIGDILTYTVTITVPEGQYSNVQLVDTLDRGLAFVAVDSTSSSGAISSSAGSDADIKNNAVISNQGGGADDAHRKLTLDFGTLTNSNNDNTSSEIITIEYRTVVINIFQSRAGRSLDNNAVLGNQSPVSDRVDIKEPSVSITNFSSNITGNVDAGDMVTWTLDIRAASGGNNVDAHDVVAVVNIPSGLTYVPSSLANTSGAMPDSSGESSGTITVTWDTLNTSSTSQIQFQTTVDASVDIGQTLTIDPQVTWTSQLGVQNDIGGGPSTLDSERTGNTGDVGGSQNNYLVDGSASVSVEKPEPIMSLVSTSDTNNSNSVVPGEIVRMRMQVRIPEGTTDNVEFLLHVPNGLEYLNDGTTKVAFVSTSGTGLTSSSITGGGISGDESTVAGITPSLVVPGGEIIYTVGSGNNLSINLGTLTNSESDPNDEFAVLEFNAVVNNQAGVENGSSLPVAAELKAGGSTIMVGGAFNLSVVEPEITINKVITNVVGNIVSYEIKIENTGTSRAYNVSLNDILGPNLNNLSNIVQTDSGTVSGITHNNPTAIDYTINEIAIGGSITITFNADIIDPNIITTGDIATTTWTSISGSAASHEGSTAGIAGTATGERIGGTGVNNYNASDNADISIVRGKVFIDADADGLEDDSSIKLSGVTVKLIHPGTNGTFGNSDDIELTAITDANGNYEVLGVPAGNVRLEVDQSTLPSGTPASIVVFDTEGSTIDNSISLTVGEGVVLENNNFGVRDPNDPPVIGGLDPSFGYTEDNPVIAIDSNMTLDDPELGTSAYNNWNKATLEIVRTGGSDSDDIFDAVSGGNLDALTQGNPLVVDGTTIGSITTNSNGTLLLTFNGDATTALVNQAIQQIGYLNINDNASKLPTSVTLQLTVNDRNGVVDNPDQGSGSALTDVKTITVNITPTNDLPISSSVDIDINEDTNHTFASTDFAKINDPEDGNGVDATSIQIKTLPANGVLKFNGSPVSPDDIIPMANIGNLVFEPSLNENGNNYGDFTFKVGDTDSGFSTTTYNFGIDVLPVNDPPVIGNLDSSFAYTEDNPVIAIDSDMTLADPELDTREYNDLNKATLEIVRDGGANSDDIFDAVSGGNLNALTQGNPLVVGGTTIGSVTTNSNGTLLLTFNGDATTALVNQAIQQIGYLNTNDNASKLPTSVTLQLTVNDRNGVVDNPDQGSGSALTDVKTITVNITPTNDLPISSSVDIDINEDTNHTFASTDFAKINDPEDGNGVDATSIQIKTLPANGVLKFNGSPVSPDDIIPMANIGNLVFEPSLNENGNNYGDFTFKVGDTDSGFSTTTYNFGIDVLPVNDPPSINNANGGNTYVENGAAIIIDNDISFRDPELDNVEGINNWNSTTLSIERNGGASNKDVFVATGTLNALTQGTPLVVDSTVIGTVTSNTGGSLLLTFNGNATTALVNSAAQKIAYRYNGENPPTNIDLHITINDKNSGSQGSGPELLNDVVIPMNITPVNDAPTSGPKILRIDEDTTFTFAINNFCYSDQEDPSPNATAIRIDSLPANGKLTLNGVDVSAGQVILAADVANLIFRPNSNESGDNYGDFTFSVQDNQGKFSLTSSNYEVHVNPISDAPTLVAPSQLLVDGLSRKVILDIDALLVDTDSSEVIGSDFVLSNLAPGILVSKGGVSIPVISGTVNIPRNLPGDIELSFDARFTLSTTDITFTASSQDNPDSPVSSSVDINIVMLPVPNNAGGSVLLFGDDNTRRDSEIKDTNSSNDNKFSKANGISFNTMKIEPRDNPLYLQGDIKGRLVIEEELFTIIISKHIFKHDNPNESLFFSAQMLDGSPLPSWLNFDSKTLTFTGTPPLGTRGIVVISIIAKDRHDNEAEAPLFISINKGLEELKQKKQLYQDFIDSTKNLNRKSALSQDNENKTSNINIKNAGDASNQKNENYKSFTQQILTHSNGENKLKQIWKKLISDTIN